MAAPDLNKCTRVLIVEGYDDLLFYAEILEWVKNGDKVFIQPMGGKSNMTSAARRDDLVIKLETFLSPELLSAKTSIGVIVDADSAGAGTAQSLEERLEKITGQAVETDQFTAGPPRIGLHVVPGAGKAGEIESLVWESWSKDPANTTAKGCIDSFLDCMKASGHVAKSPDKGRIGALLAVRNDEDPRLGPGARARVFDFARPELAPLVAFLSAL
jgi:hypothetical protein